MSLPVSLVEKGSSVGLSIFTTPCGSDPYMSLLASKRSAKIDSGHYIVEKLAFLG